MGQIEVRPVVFGEWRRWDTSAVPLSPPQGGVYLLAHSQSGAAPAMVTPDNLPVEVVYVGFTKNLNTRPSRNHEGVKRYHEKIDKEKVRLFVTIAPLYVKGCKDSAVQRVYAEHIETLLIWKFTELHGHPPVLRYGHKGSHPKEVAALIEALRAT